MGRGSSFYPFFGNGVRFQAGYLPVFFRQPGREEARLRVEDRAEVLPHLF
jgi:hypothetical protein